MKYSSTIWLRQGNLSRRSAKKKQLRFLLVPGNPKLTFWHGFMSVVVIIAVALAPAEMAFLYTDLFKGSDWFLQVVDVFFLVDMGVKFFVARTSHGRLVTDHKVVAQMYLKSWFIPDLLINFPWSLALSGLSGEGSRITKVLKLPKALRVTRLLRVAGEEAHYLGTAANIAGLMLVAHYCCCFWVWYFVACTPEDLSMCSDAWTAYFQGFSIGMSTIGGADSWLRILRDPSTVFTPRDTASDYSLRQTWKAYEVECNLFSVCSSLIGACLLGTLFSSISHATDAHGSHSRLFRSRINNLQAARERVDMSEDLFKRLKRHYYYVWSCGSDTTKAMLEDTSLSVDLRRQLALCFYGQFFAQVPFLEDAKPDFIRQLCEFVELEIFAAGDRIASAGEAANELYFVAVGKAQIVMPPDDGESESEGEVITLLDEGSFFGELGLLFPDSQSRVNVNAITAGKLLVVPRGTLEYFCSEELLDTFRSVAIDRLRTQPHLAQIMQIHHDDIQGSGDEEDQGDKDGDQVREGALSPSGSAIEALQSPQSSKRSSGSQRSEGSLHALYPALHGSLVPGPDDEPKDEAESSQTHTTYASQPSWLAQRQPRKRASTMVLPGPGNLSVPGRGPVPRRSFSNTSDLGLQVRTLSKSSVSSAQGLEQRRQSELQAMGAKTEAKLEHLVQTFSSFEARVGSIDSRIALSHYSSTMAA